VFTCVGWQITLCDPTCQVRCAHEELSKSGYRILEWGPVGSHNITEWTDLTLCEALRLSQDCATHGQDCIWPQRFLTKGHEEKEEEEEE